MARAKKLVKLGKWEVGMRVLLTGGIDTGTSDIITVIRRITDGRGGSIYTKNYSFDKNGHQRGGNSWFIKFIRPATVEDVNRVVGQKYKNSLSHFEWRKLSREDAITIVKFMKEKLRLDIS